MEKIIIAIDPGKNGAIVIYRNLNDITSFVMPLLGKELNEKEICFIIKSFKSDNCFGIIEKVHSMPSQGVSSMFTFGMGYGMVRMAFTANDIPYQLVTPQAWKKHVLVGLEKDKSATINYVARKYPKVNLVPGRKKTPHDGIADAVCIAEYGKTLIRE